MTWLGRIARDALRTGPEAMLIYETTHGTEWIIVGETLVEFFKQLARDGGTRVVAVIRWKTKL